ncbi:MAG: alpha/beta hydrolase [Planctomycetes bacterium]|nr:alpha/beta hydrolase [Planctomycetota bacterium]
MKREKCLVPGLAFLGMLAMAGCQAGELISTKGTATMDSVPGTIRIKGDSPAGSNFIADHFDPLHITREDGRLNVRAFEELNGGRPSLLCTKTKPHTSYSATYQFTAGDVRQAALWVFEQGRAWASPFAWRIDDGPWRKAPAQLWMQKSRSFKDGPTFSWCRLGDVSLSAGKHALEISVSEPKEDGVYLISQDSFVFMPKEPLVGDYAENYPFAIASTDFEKPGKQAIFLWDATPPDMKVDDGFRPWLEPYPMQTDRPLGAVLVIPGGAYRVRAPYEGTPVAKRFNEAGLHAFVLQYRVAPHMRQEALADGQRAIRLIRANAARWNVAADRLAVCGFSAGAHLSGSLGMNVLDGRSDAADPLERFSSRPDAIILGYSPANGSFDVDKGLPANFPPTFIWHTVEDAQVPVDNSIRIAQALRKSKIPFEIHLYPHGPHGLALAEKNPHVASWVPLCLTWLDELGWKK